MRRNATRSLLLVLGAVALFATGCARKPPQAAPTPAPTPPVSTPTPAPTPTPTPPPAPAATPTESTKIEDVFFDYDSAVLGDEARAILDRNARLLRDRGSMSLSIEGHCDERGTVKYNLDLGEKRAASVKEYLVGAGVAASRLSTISYGKERPFAEGHDDASWAQNRRAHLVTR